MEAPKLPGDYTKNSPGADGPEDTRGDGERLFWAGLCTSGGGCARVFSHKMPVQPPSLTLTFSCSQPRGTTPSALVRAIHYRIAYRLGCFDDVGHQRGRVGASETGLCRRHRSSGVVTPTRDN